MNDFIAGPASGAGDEGTGPWGGGTPPPVLLAAMGAALLIAVTLVAFLIGNGSGDGASGRPLPAGSAGVDDPTTGSAAPAAAERVLLTVSVEGGGSGKVLIEPRGASCAETCSHEFSTGTRVTVSADAADGSRFEGWEDACTGLDRCSFFMDRERSLTATFEGQPASLQCEDGKDNDSDGLTDEGDPGCDKDNTEAPDNTPTDCDDGRDNDSDGLIDRAQDPDCGDGTESGAGDVITPPPPPPPPPPLPPATTTPVAPPPPPGTQPISECRDGQDNDGDGKVDRPGDPGCDADGTEAGG